MPSTEPLPAGGAPAILARRQAGTPRRSGGRLRALIGGDALTGIGVVLVLMLVLLALFGGTLAPFHPLKPVADTFLPPTGTHWFGTDEFGRDVFSRVLFAFRLDMFIAITAVVGAAVIGLGLGSLAGFIGGIVDDVFMRVVDVIQSFPMLILAMALVAFLGVGVLNVILVTMIVNVAIFARLSRSDILSKKRLEYVDAARCSGASPLRVLFVHLIPNILGPIIVQGTLSLAWAVLNVAALSFLGIGINPPTPELGVMVAEGARYLSDGRWWLSVFPGLALALAVFAFNLMGDAVQDRLDPRRRTSQ